MSRSGPNWTQAQRLASGRPLRQFSLSTEVDLIISRLAAELGLPRSRVVELAVREYLRTGLRRTA